MNPPTDKRAVRKQAKGQTIDVWATVSGNVGAGKREVRIYKKQQQGGKEREH